MHPRETEDLMLERCVAVARSWAEAARNSQEANVFELAGSVLRSRMPKEAGRLTAASTAYFAKFPQERLPDGEASRRGWVDSLPRLRDMLTAKLERSHEPA